MKITSKNNSNKNDLSNYTFDMTRIVPKKELYGPSLPKSISTNKNNSNKNDLNNYAFDMTRIAPKKELYGPFLPKSISTKSNITLNSPKHVTAKSNTTPNLIVDKLKLQAQNNPQGFKNQINNIKSIKAYNPNKTNTTLIQNPKQFIEENKDKELYGPFLPNQVTYNNTKKQTESRFEKDVRNTVANYTSNKLQVESNELWNKYRQSQSEEDLLKAQQKDQEINEFLNSDYGKRVGKGKIITKSLAGHIPQLVGQTKSGVVGATIGAGAGAGAGSIVPGIGTGAGAVSGGIFGAGSGVAKYSYEQMAGQAYRDLLNLGVENSKALEISQNTALINALIEGGETILSLATMGVGKVATAAGKTAVQKVATKEASNILSGVAKTYGVNILSEGLEEGLQETVSIAGEKVGVNDNKKGNIGDILQESGKGLKGQYSQEEYNRIFESAKAGGELAMLTGGFNASGKIITNKIINNNINSKKQEQNTLSNQKKINSLQNNNQISSQNPPNINTIKTDGYNLPTQQELRNKLLTKNQNYDEKKINDINTNNIIENTEGFKKIRNWAKTSQSNKMIRENLDVKDFEYVPLQNKVVLEKVYKKINIQGYDNSLKEFESIFESNKKVNVEDIVLGEQMIVESMQKGDFDTAQKLIEDITILGTELGQTVQAMNLIKKLTPQGQLSYLQKTINRINKQEFNKNNKFKPLKITDEMAKEILSQTSKEGLENAMDKVKQQLADKMPVSAFDKIDAWRYLSMLGNLRTHIRNIISNTSMKATIGTKNVISKTLEDLFHKNLEERTKTFKKSSQEIKDFAKQSAIDMQDIITKNDKYSMESEMNNLRTIFKSKSIEKLRKLNNKALEFEDWLFSKPAYINTLSTYLTANGIKTKADIDSKINKKTIEKAKQYAVLKAQEATFRQFNVFANMINTLEKKNKYSRVIVGGIMPFKKTPANIAMVGAKYSPIGLLETLTVESIKLKKGKITPNHYIDRISEGLTGTGLTLLGILLSSLGLLTAGVGNSKEEEYEKNIGLKRAYSINIGNTSYGLEWLSPVAIPLFVGTELVNQIENAGNYNFTELVDAMTKTFDPLSEMSIIQGINSTFKTYDDNNLEGIIKNATRSYLGQFIPTISSQLNKVIDTTVRTSKGEGTGIDKTIDGFTRQMKNKFIGTSKLNEPLTDTWGKEKKQPENVITRIFNSMINPSNVSNNLATDIDKKILELYKQNEDADIIPSIPNNYFTLNNVRYDLTAKEYTQFKKDYGTYCYEEIKKKISSSYYQKNTTKNKQKEIKNIYNKAREIAKENYFKRKEK